jgi:hypothetical protein
MGFLSLRSSWKVPNMRSQMIRMPPWFLQAEEQVEDLVGMGSVWRRWRLVGGCVRACVHLVGCSLIPARHGWGELAGWQAGRQATHERL